MNFFIILLIFLFSPVAFGSLSVQTLRPSNNFTYTTLEDSLSQHYLLNQYERDYYLNIQYNTIGSPISRFDVNNQNRMDLADRISSIDFSIQKPITRRFSLAADLSLSEVIIDKTNRFGINDLRIQSEYQLLDRNRKFIGASILGELYLPTGNGEYFLSNDSVGGGGKIVLEKKFHLFNAVFNFGYLKFGDAQYRNLNYSEQLAWGIGFYLPLGKRFSMNIEGNSVYLPKDSFSSGTGELYLGGQYALAYNSRLIMGVSYSQTEEDNSANFRFLLGYKFLPFMKEPIEKTRAPIKIVERIERVVEKQVVHNQLVECGPTKYSKKYMARTFTNAELAKNPELPYKSTARNKIPNLKIGQATGTSEGVSYVLDSQVLFAIDMPDFPNSNSVINIDSARLLLDVRKVPKNNYSDTEILCILNNKVCSGELYDDPKKKENINFNFFGGKETPNDYFKKQFTENPIGTLGDKKIYSSSLNIDLKKVIENSLVRGLKNVFYKNGMKVPTLYFTVADDTYVSSNAYLDIQMTVDSCKEKSKNKNKNVRGKK